MGPPLFVVPPTPANSEVEEEELKRNKFGFYCRSYLGMSSIVFGVVSESASLALG